MHALEKSNLKETQLCTSSVSPRSLLADLRLLGKNLLAKLGRAGTNLTLHVFGGIPADGNDF